MHGAGRAPRAQAVVGDDRALSPKGSGGSASGVRMIAGTSAPHLRTSQRKLEPNPHLAPADKWGPAFARKSAGEAPSRPAPDFPAKAGTQLTPCASGHLGPCFRRGVCVRGTIPSHLQTSQRKLGPNSHHAQADIWVPAFAGMTIEFGAGPDDPSYRTYLPQTPAQPHLSAFISPTYRRPSSLW